MKQLTIAIVTVLLCCSSAVAQKKCLKRFFREQKGMSFGIKIGVGALPLRIASSFIPADSETVALKHMLRHVQHVKVYAISGNRGEVVTPADVEKLKNTLQLKEHFEPLVDVRNGSSFVHVLNRGTEDELGNVIMLVQDENNFVIVHLRTTLDMKDVNGLIQQFAKN